ncbi:nicotinate-nucleotide adenylyltransferase [Paenibacillus koleovorans]|uniref:nicotinate-nucleotide adenylyltransferase n=1 Tax=Paenibacillus koleovorans TaxID=121608 RepID=UPI000FD76DC4|nr:nicotinate-nucleotide adenylyltransferase [Paenibacillus koleovorans]
MNIGIMGGTFDPIHLGHLLAAERAREEAGLDEVWFMPSYTPPHKPNPPKASAEQRLAMLELAIAGHPQFRAEELEIRRQGTSYTVDTVDQLCRRYPNARFCYIVGADMVQYLPHWVRIEEIIKRISFIGLQRPGYSVDLSSLPAAIREAVTIVPMSQMELSSTDIRERCRSDKSIRYMVHEDVYAYIKERGLYEA